MALQGLYVPAKAAWLPSLQSELLTFPAGKHFDQVDALGLVGQLLDQMVKGRKPDPKDDRTIKLTPLTFYEAFKRHQRKLRELESLGLIER